MTLKKKYNRLTCGAHLLLLLLLPLCSFGNNDAAATFEKGNRQYTKGRYNDAVQSYTQILNEGYRSATIYFNLGDAYYKLDDIPSALLYYEKAHNLNPADEDINFNIRLANLKTTDKLEQLPEFFVTAWWHSFILFLSADTMAILSVLFLLGGFGALVLYLFTSSVLIKKTSFFGSLVSIGIGIMFILIANRQAYYFNNHHQAIIFSSSVTAKSTPGGSGTALFVVHEGTKVTIKQTGSTWIEVELPNGNTGWIAATDVKVI